MVLICQILQPIQVLKTAAQAISQGNWQTPLPPSRFSELRELATGLNDVAAQLRRFLTAAETLNRALAESERQLERTVAERTAALHQIQATQQLILEAIPDLLIRFNREGICLDVMSSGCLELIAQPEEKIGQSVMVMLPRDMAVERLYYIQQALATGQPQIYEYKFERSNGWRYEEARVIKSGDDEVLVMVRDITERKQTEAALDSQKQFLQNVIDSIPSIIVVKARDERIQIANRASAAMHGITPADMLGKLDTEINPNISFTEAEHHCRINQQVIETQAPYQAEQEIVDMNGVSHWYQLLISPFRDANGNVNGVVANGIDITDRKQIETAFQEANEKLERLATLDGLTQISNRRRFDEYLRQEWQRMVREQQPLSLVLFDVDFFKTYNDHFGHQQGDEALIAVAQAANRSVKRAADLLARYGGEEFGVILPNTRRTGAESVARAIQEQIAALQLVHPQSQVNEYLTVSMGIASVVPTPEQSADELVAAADAALYQAKRRGRNRYWIRLL
ncbi:MAG: diguanylate cyclase [Leptolyngbyaceae cyanobacterium SM2_5_2]|nr:diguanylate cyclase [Leptolyngbyaceae cyanobacterium SM2_5_2]